MDQMEAVYLKMLYLIAFFFFFKDTEDETVFDKLHHFGICFTRKNQVPKENNN